MSLVNAPSSRSLMAIDLLRFGAAMLVVANHYFTTFTLDPDSVIRFVMPIGSNWNEWAPFTAFGWIGVEIFFVISGYVIAMSAVNASGSSFFRRRVERLLPVAFICASVTAVALIAAGVPLEPISAAWQRSVTFFPIGEQIDVSYWTLGIEVNFYILVGLMITLSRGEKTLDTIAILVGVFSTVFWLVIEPNDFLGARSSEDRYVQLALLVHGCFFALGMTVWRLAHRPPRWSWIVYATGLTMVCFIEIFNHGQERWHAMEADFGQWGGPALFAGTLLLIVFAKPLQPWIGKRLNGNLIITLGMATYPLYLIHQYSGAVIIAKLLGLGIPYLLSALITWGLAIGFSVLIVTYCEKPIVMAVRSLLNRVIAPRGQARDNHPIPSP